MPLTMQGRRSRLGQSPSLFPAGEEGLPDSDASTAWNVPQAFTLFTSLLQPEYHVGGNEWPTWLMPVSPSETSRYS